MTIQKFILPKHKTLIGMVHLKALPGTPKNNLVPDQIIESALNEAQILKDAGFDALLIENMHDTPYLKTNIGHEISTLMAIASYEIKKLTKLPVGLQMLAGANLQALAAAHSANLDFIRAEGFVYGHLADEGLFESCAGELLRFRKQIGAERIAVFTDIKKKHASHALTSDISIEETAETAEYFGSDGLILTGSATGKETSKPELLSVRKNTNLPIIIGSGINQQNIDSYLPLADAFIIGSSIKKQKKWYNEIDADYCKNLVEKARSLSNN